MHLGIHVSVSANTNKTIECRRCICRFRLGLLDVISECIKKTLLAIRDNVSAQCTTHCIALLFAVYELGSCVKTESL